MILFWLSAMGAVAAARGNFKYDVVASCVSDGSSVNSGHCTISKRVNVASYAALDVMSGVAGISAIIMYVLNPEVLEEAGTKLTMLFPGSYSWRRLPTSVSNSVALASPAQPMPRSKLVSLATLTTQLHNINSQELRCNPTYSDTNTRNLSSTSS